MTRILGFCETLSQYFVVFLTLVLVLGFFKNSQAKSLSGEGVVKISLINPTQYAAPESYLSPFANIITDSLTLNPSDTLANLESFVDRESPIFETSCFYPDLKLVFRNYTYIVSTHCGSIYKFKNDLPYSPTTKRLATDFIFTESLLGYFQRIKKYNLGNDNAKYFSSLKIHSALSVHKSINSANTNIASKQVSKPTTKPVNNTVTTVKKSEVATKEQPNPKKVPTLISPKVENETAVAIDNSKRPAPEKVGISTDDYEQRFNYPALIRSVTLTREDGDSMLYVDKTDLTKPVYFMHQNIAVKPTLKESEQNIQFTFAAPANGKPIYFQYCWKMEGVDENWSDWSDKNIANYTHLPQGEFTMKVKAKNNFGKLSNEASFSFMVVPEWYKEKPSQDFVSQIRRVLIKRSGNDSVIYRGANVTTDIKTIVLDNDYNNLRFEFVKLERPGAKAYQYYVQNIDETWKEWTANEYIDLANLPYGDYTFHLRTKDGSGDYSKETTIPFVIERAWHESWAFYGGLSASFLLLTIASAWNERKKSIGHKWLSALMFLGLCLIGEIIFYNFQRPVAYDPTLLGAIKLGIYGFLAIFLSWLPLEKLFIKFDPKFNTSKEVAKTTKSV